MWVTSGPTKLHVWQDSTIKSRKQAFHKGLTTGLQAPTSKGQRLILTHAGNEHGFVDGAMSLFKAKTGDEEYHEKMDGIYFGKWFNLTLLQWQIQGGYGVGTPPPQVFI